MTDTQPASLIDEQLSEVLRLIKGADSVELKLTVPDADRRSAVAALDMDALEAQIRQVVFFDTPDLTLNEHGVVVRARRVRVRARLISIGNDSGMSATVARIQGKGRDDEPRRGWE